ncbi:hypothetical protein GCM10029978_091680 [Actinoallomurus acanthiterrae]
MQVLQFLLRAQPVHPPWRRRRPSAITAVSSGKRGSPECASTIQAIPNPDTSSREQKGRFVALCWIAQIYKHIPEPKSSYVADWDALPEWQQKTDIDIFEEIENHA